MILQKPHVSEKSLFQVKNKNALNQLDFKLKTKMLSTN